MARSGGRKPQLITFYSYKGGVGRTMAVANAACQLAIKHGRHVICIDWDLEAPGLHHYFGYSEDELAGRAGLLDYLNDFVWEVEHRGAAGQPPRLENHLQNLKPEDNARIRFGSVRFMHCGRTDERYMERVQTFDWDAFYEQHRGYEIIETLKQQLREAADITLIDARAGQADIGTTATVQIPDAVVLLFTSNRQSLMGTEEVARRLAHHPQRRIQGQDPPRIVLIPARIFPKEEGFGRWMESSSAPVFDRLVREGIVSLQDQPNGLRTCSLPVDSKCAVEERLVVLESTLAASDLVEAYASLAQALDNLHEGRDAWAPPEPITLTPPEEASPIGEIPLFIQGAIDLRQVEQPSAEELRCQLAQAEERGDAERAAYLEFKLAQHAIRSRRFDEASALLHASLAYHQSKGQAESLAGIFHEKGTLRREQGRLDEAWKLYERALELERQIGHARAERATLLEMGNLRRMQDNLDEAWELYQRALESAERAGDLHGQGVTLHEMGTVRRTQGDLDAAWALYERALELKTKAGNTRSEGVTLHEMGTLRLYQGRWEEAWEFYERSLIIDEQCADPRGQAITLRAMGDVRLLQGNLDEAWKLYERSLAPMEGEEVPLVLAATRIAMATILLRQAQYDAAKSLLEYGLALAEQAEDKASIDRFRHALARIAQ